jgi:hypothetical protein
MGHCAKCKRDWKGLAECHCSECCLHFKSLSAFDKHRTGTPEKRKCLREFEMKDKGMVLITEKDIWVGSQNTRFSGSHDD